MEIVDVKNNPAYLKEYITLCSEEWGSKKDEEEMKRYIDKKEHEILDGNKVISILGLTKDSDLIGFISLFEYEDEETPDVTPWYATMYVKKEFRGNGYSKILNEEVLKEAKKLGYDKVYLKSELVNYYEKFGAKYMCDLDNGEKMYYIDL